MKWIRFSLLTLTALAAVALGSGSARADIIFSNFSPSNGNGFGGLGSIITGPTSSAGQAQSLAAKFTPTQNYTLTSFEVGGYHNNGTNLFQFSIVNDNGGLPTGSSVLASFTGPLNGTFGQAAITQFAASGQVQAGSTYWLVVEAGASNARGGWSPNTTGGIGVHFKNANTGGVWTSDTFTATPTFRINGNLTTPVTPEVPGIVMVAPVLLAVGGMGILKRRKRAE